MPTLDAALLHVAPELGDVPPNDVTLALLAIMMAEAAVTVQDPAAENAAIPAAAAALFMPLPPIASTVLEGEASMLT